MTLLPLHGPQCANDQVVKRGKTSNEKQRYLCQNEACPQQTFLLEYSHRGRLPQVKQQIVDMALNGSGIRDTARVLRISKDTVLSELKKRGHRGKVWVKLGFHRPESRVDIGFEAFCEAWRFGMMFGCLPRRSQSVFRTHTDSAA